MNLQASVIGFEWDYFYYQYPGYPNKISLNESFIVDMYMHGIGVERERDWNLAKKISSRIDRIWRTNSENPI